ncbi:MAG: hypothetical protein KAI72_09935 [Candidatus Pacebacteria bacterium]|nr:hypothetical protein [Candidatus Paceibacterota bacterium]
MEKDSKIKKTKEGLYSREKEETPIMKNLEKKEFDVREDWGQEEPSVTEPKVQDIAPNKKKSSMAKNILILSLVFFIGAITFAFYILYNGTNISSVDNIEMSVTGPVDFGSGEEVKLRIFIENKNTSNLESAELLIDFPDGAKGSFTGENKTSRLTKSLGTISESVLINEEVFAEFFGEENEVKNVFVTLEYRFEGSNAILQKQTEKTVRIISSPVNFTIDMLDEATSNQEIEMVVSIDSDTPETVKDLLFEIYYPFGFTFLEAEPKPKYGDKIWALSDLEPFGSQEIRIRGTIKGEDDSNKVFSASLGVPDPKDPKNIDTVFSSTEESIIIKRPFIGLQVLIDREDASDYVVIDGKERVTVSVPWINNLDNKIIGAKIEVKLGHDIIDRNSISVVNDDGFYRSVDDTIVWNSQTNESLGVVSPGATGVVGFTFELLPISSSSNLFKNVEISIEATAQGLRLSNMEVPEKIKSPVIGKARLLSDVNLLSRVLYYDGPFANTGAMPPKVNKETTYTVVWQVTNGTNKISNTTIRSNLPTYVSWKGVVSPDSENVIYNELGGEIIWNATNIEAGAGITEEPKEVAFQIGFIPSLTQEGKVPFLLNETTLTAVDDFTGLIVNDSEEKRSIMLLSDPYFDKKEGQVVK